ncbi:MAG: 50S ribosomal protein L25 [Planctomycetota bacterium]
MTAYAAEERTAFGSKVAQREREAGRVPVTVTMGGKPSRHVTLNEKDAEGLANGDMKSALSIDGAEQRVLRKAVDRHPVNDRLLHIDLQAIEDDTIVKVEVPLDPDVQSSPGIRAGGLLEMMRRTVTVRCKAKDLPRRIKVPLDGVDVTDTVYAADCELPEGVELVTGKRVAILSILLTRGMRKAQQEATKTDG